MQRMKSIIDVFESTSWQIYTEKKIALDSNDEELNMRVLEGQDLMSVMRSCKYPWRKIDADRACFPQFERT